MSVNLRNPSSVELILGETAKLRGSEACRHRPVELASFIEAYPQTGAETGQLYGRSQRAINTNMLLNTNSRPTALCLLFSFSISNLPTKVSLAGVAFWCSFLTPQRPQTRNFAPEPWVSAPLPSCGAFAGPCLFSGGSLRTKLLILTGFGLG